MELTELEEKKKKMIVEVVSQSPNSKVLIFFLLQNTTLYNELKNGSLGPITLLAPTDTAFANLTEEEWKTLEDKTVADELLRRHIVTGRKSE